MILYAESSAVLSWLLGEPAQRGVIAELEAAEQVVTSALTGVECARALARARAAQRIKVVEERAALHLLDEAMVSWHVLDVSEDVIVRARGEFPREPVRSLDALHLASASLLFDAAGTLTLLSLDERVRANGRALGMQVMPNS
jgi:predicted nucleic acid-binding protein